MKAMARNARFMRAAAASILIVGSALRFDLPLDDVAVSERQAGGNTAGGRLSGTDSRIRRLSRAEPGLPRRYADAPDRRRRRCGLSAAGRMPLCLHRFAAGTQLCAPCRSHWPALCARPAHRGLSTSAVAAPSPSRSIARKPRNDSAAADRKKAGGVAARAGAAFADFARAPQAAMAGERLDHRGCLAGNPARGHSQHAAARCLSDRAGALLPKWVRQTFEWITWFGNSGWFLFPTGILLLVIAASPWSKLPRFSQAVLATIAVRAGFIFLAVGVPALFVTIIKRLIGRARPYVSQITDPYSYDPFIWTACLCQPAVRACHQCLRRCHRDRRALAEGAASDVDFALVIAMSRVVVNAHFPSDVIAGAVTGTVGALLVRGWFAARRLGFTVGSDATIHRLPGPSWRRTKAVARRLLAP